MVMELQLDQVVADSSVKLVRRHHSAAPTEALPEGSSRTAPVVADKLEVLAITPCLHQLT